MANVDFSSYFNNLQTYSETMNQSKSNFSNFNGAGSMLNLCRQSNLGSALLRPIVDELGIPMKTLNNIFEIWESTAAVDDNGNPVLNEDGSQRYKSTAHTIADICNYQSRMLKLDPTQIQVLTSLINTLNKYSDYVEDGIIDTDETGITIKFRKEISLFWAKVISLTDKQGKSVISDGLVKLCVHKSANFARSFIKATQDRTNIMRDGGAWQAKFFGNEVGQNAAVTSISTDLGVAGQPGYSMTISFAEGATFEITQDDVDLCKDLNTQIVDVTTFDADYFNGLNERISKFIAEADAKTRATNGMTMAAQPQFQTIDQSQIVQTPVTPNPATQVNNGPTPAEVMGSQSGPYTTPQPQINTQATPSFGQMPPVQGFQIPTNSL